MHKKFLKYGMVEQVKKASWLLKRYLKEEEEAKSVLQVLRGLTLNRTIIMLQKSPNKI